jgi:hypothetical protein
MVRGILPEGALRGGASPEGADFTYDVRVLRITVAAAPRLKV